MSRPVIVVVDDDHEVLHAVERDLRLRYRQSYRIVAAQSSRQAFDATQELQYPAIMRAIVELGYTGFVAQEFVPARDPLTSLREGYDVCNV